MPSATLGVGTSMGTGGGCCAGVPGASSGPLLEAVLLGTETSGSCSCGQALAQHGLGVHQSEPKEDVSNEDVKSGIPRGALSQHIDPTCVDCHQEDIMCNCHNQ